MKRILYPFCKFAKAGTFSWVEERMMLSGTVYRGDRVIGKDIALNDIDKIFKSYNTKGTFPCNYNVV